MERKLWMKQSQKENITYSVVWGLLFAAPLLSLYVRTVSDSNVTFEWTEVFIVWRKFAVYLLLFLLHNFLLAPLLVHQHRRVAYFTIVTVVVGVFAVYQCTSRPEIPSGHPDKELFLKHERPPYEPQDLPERLPRPRGDGRPADAPPPIVGEHDILAIVVLILLFGANLGIKGYFRSSDDRKRLAQLEHENLEQQLEYLRYQINPHFFMNTLNNIHALVDIDPEQAKSTIVELSRMMRFVLYEGNKQSVPLSREIDFIRHYVALMQLRYTDKVRIDIDLPHELPDRQIPPLILITFIENAFKHGVSYQRESFIEVKTTVEHNELQFTCRNSKAKEQPSSRPALEGAGNEKGGIGLANIRKRLDLLYGNAYQLAIHDETDVYAVRLVIPLQVGNNS